MRLLSVVLISIAGVFSQSWFPDRFELEAVKCLFLRHDCDRADVALAKRIFDRVMSRPGSSGNVLKLDVYMESQCPDTSRFVRKQLVPAMQKLGSTGRIDLTMIPFGKARCTERAGDDYNCTCQHGNNECILNSLMSCVIEKLGKEHRNLLHTIDCIQGQPHLDSALDQCVKTNPELDVYGMRQCASSPHGRRLLAVAGGQTASLQPRLNFVPWIVIDGERVVDALYALTENLCQRLEPAPLACSTGGK